MKSKTDKEFLNLNYSEAIKKYPNLETWATGFLLTCHAQASLNHFCDGRKLRKLQKEVDRRFKGLQI